MSLPAFHPRIGDDIREKIDQRLAGVEAGHGVRILFAVESGSRAWGFPAEPTTPGPGHTEDARRLFRTLVEGATA